MAHPSTWLGPLELDAITQTPLPHQLGPHATAQWLGTHAELAGCVIELANRGVLVEQFRGFCLTGGGQKENSSWRQASELPVFGGAITPEDYDRLLARRRTPNT